MNRIDKLILKLNKAKTKKKYAKIERKLISLKGELTKKQIERIINILKNNIGNKMFYSSLIVFVKTFLFFSFTIACASLLFLPLIILFISGIKDLIIIAESLAVFITVISGITAKVSPEEVELISEDEYIEEFEKIYNEKTKELVKTKTYNDNVLENDLDQRLMHIYGKFFEEIAKLPTEKGKKYINRFGKLFKDYRNKCESLEGLENNTPIFNQDFRSRLLDELEREVTSMLGEMSSESEINLDTKISRELESSLNKITSLENPIDAKNQFVELANKMAERIKSNIDSVGTQTIDVITRYTVLMLHRTDISFEALLYEIDPLYYPFIQGKIEAVLHNLNDLEVLLELEAIQNKKRNDEDKIEYLQELVGLYRKSTVMASLNTIEESKRQGKVIMPIQ